jgi:hypothetical protein
MTVHEVAAVINEVLTKKGYDCHSSSIGDFNITDIHRNDIWICNYDLDEHYLYLSDNSSSGPFHIGGHFCLADPNSIPQIIAQIDRWYAERFKEAYDYVVAEISRACDDTKQHQ